MTTNCIICGQPVTPATGAILGALGRPISVRGRAIVYHTGECAELVHGAIGMVGKGAVAFMRASAPRLVKFLVTLRRAV